MSKDTSKVTAAPEDDPAAAPKRRTLAVLEELGLADKYGKPPSPTEIEYRPSNPSEWLGAVDQDLEYLRVTTRDQGHQARELVAQGFVPAPDARVRMRELHTPDEVIFVRHKATGDKVRREEHRRRQQQRSQRAATQVQAKDGTIIRREMASEAVAVSETTPPLRS